MATPDTTASIDATRTLRMTYADGSMRTVVATPIEREFPAGRLIVSRTDLNGYITHANDAFVEISGWRREELIGAPHHILRHPDMPRKAYKDLWDSLARSQKWHGYVKNLCKDGSFYWVYATAVPNVRQGVVVGYTSVRRKPSRTRVMEVMEQYREWLRLERPQQQEQVSACI